MITVFFHATPYNKLEIPGSNCLVAAKYFALSHVTPALWTIGSQFCEKGKVNLKSNAR